MILDEILATKRQEVATRSIERPISALESAIARMLPVRSFTRALEGPGVSVIAEIKRKSPSGGELRAGASAADLGRVYGGQGAAAISVLTDFTYFGGCDADLADARTASGVPALRKEFVVDPYQVYEARGIGADAVLLIVRALSQHDLCQLLELARTLSLAALVETHNGEEMRRALDAGADLVGVNNRDLDTLTIDRSLAIRLRPLVPAGVTFVAESGITEPEHLWPLRDANVNAVLIGQVLVQSPDPGARLRAFVDAGAKEKCLPFLGRGWGLGKPE